MTRIPTEIYTPVLFTQKIRNYQPPQELKRGDTKRSQQDFLVNYWSGRQHISIGIY